MLDIRAKVLWWAVKRRVAIDKPFIIGVTGSIAKTSTKVAIGAVLRRAYPNQVRVGYGNLNSFLGVPLALLGFRFDFYKQPITWQWIWLLKQAIWRGLFGALPDYIILEYGADHPGDIEALAKMLPIDAAIITITGPAHLENYSSIEQIAEEKAKILSAVKKGGWVLVNKSDPYLHSYQKKNCPLDKVETETINIAVNFARAVGDKMKIGPDVIDAALSALTRPEGRLQLKDLGKSKLLDDSYNASPLSMTAALGALDNLPSPKLAILGDMLELGRESEKFHRDIGAAAHKIADKIIGVGELARFYQPDQWFANSSDAIGPILSEVDGYGSILVKGSHGVQMGAIVKALTDNFQKR